MNLTENIARHILEIHLGTTWTDVDLSSTLVGVTAQEAMVRTPASVNTIAALLHHITYWNRIILYRIQGIAVEVPDTNGFDVPQLHTEEDWEKLKTDNMQSAHELAAAVESFDEDRLFEPILPGNSSAFDNFEGTVAHIHYHLGQITLLKQLIKAGI
jgi:uncharacterized damage-inducible protein DinB